MTTNKEIRALLAICKEAGVDAEYKTGKTHGRIIWDGDFIGISTSPSDPSWYKVAERELRKKLNFPKVVKKNPNKKKHSAPKATAQPKTEPVAKTDKPDPKAPLADLKKQMKICEPGVYDLSIEDYHSDICIGPSISSTGLRQVLECPAKYWLESPYNPKRIESEQKGHFELGKAVHGMVLEGTDPDDVYHVLPKGFNASHGKFANDLVAMEAAKEAGKTIVRATEFDLQKIKDMISALKQHEYAWAFFENGLAERSIIWKDKHTGIWLKARPDWTPNEPMIIEGKSLWTIPDLKGASDASPEAFSRAIATHGYHIQLALMYEGFLEMLRLGILDIDPKIFALVVQETKAPYVVEPYQIDTYSIEYGRLELRRAINLYAHCMETGKWGGYSWRNPQEAIQIGLPRWRQMQLETAIERGDYEKEKGQIYEYDPKREEDAAQKRFEERYGDGQNPLDAG